MGQIQRGITLIATLMEGAPMNPSPISKNEADRLRRNIAAYGVHLSELPERAWQTSVCRWMEDYWDVLVDLFTEEEGESDLVLFIKVYEREVSYRFNVESVHVP